MASVYYEFNEAAKQLGVVNPVPKTAGVLDCWNKAKGKYSIAGSPQPGDQFIMDFGAGHGHTGLIEKIIGNKMQTLEGNTSSDPSLPSEDREGNGFFTRLRPISSVNKGFLRYT